MVTLESRPLFGNKKHLAEEQYYLYDALGNIEKGATWADPRILGTYWAEGALMAFPPHFRREKALKFFRKAKENLDAVM
jgi:hypothetical protein